MPIRYRTADGNPPFGGRPISLGRVVTEEPPAPVPEKKSSKESKSSEPVAYVPLPSWHGFGYPPCLFHHAGPAFCCVAEEEGKEGKEGGKTDKKKKDGKKSKKEAKKAKEGKKDKKGKGKDSPKEGGTDASAQVAFCPWTLPKPPEPKAPAKEEKAKKEEKPKENANSPAGSLLLPPLVTMHLLRRTYKPWLPENVGMPFQFKVCRAPPSITVKELIDVLFDGMNVKDDEKVMVECLERGGGVWSRGSIWKHDEDESNQRLYDIGWTAKRGVEMKPVWLAWGVSDP